MDDRTNRPPRFPVRRADGRTLQEFLSQSPVYYSPQSEQPRLEDIQPLEPHHPALLSLLRGLDAENLILAGLLEPAGTVVASARELIGQVIERSEQRAQDLQKVAVLVTEAARQIASSEFPLGRTMEVLFEEVQHRQRRWTRWAAWIRW